MNNSIFSKVRMASAIAIAVAGSAVMTSAQADSLLGPMIVNNATYSTFLNMKFKGKSASDKIHYVWLRKRAQVGGWVTGITAADALSNATALDNPRNWPFTCKMINNNGKTSKGDMIFQDTQTTGSFTPNGPHPDNGTGAVYGVQPFVGMVVITDMSNKGADGDHKAPEGDSSGFAYIVDNGTGDVTSYKLLNNHKSAAEGDFRAEFISKHVVDLAWMGSQEAILAGGPSGATVLTGWTMGVTGSEMAKHSGGFSGEYDATVRISQDTFPGEASPQAIMGNSTGVYDSDEKLTSGINPMHITCMGSFKRSNFLDAQQLADTMYGGWARMSIIPQTTRTISLAGGATQTFNVEKKAWGGITYRLDVFDKALVAGGGGFPMPVNKELTIQVETGGHLNKVANHANRPY